MQNPRLASRYAKSLLDLAIEQNSLDATLVDMQLLDGICTQSREFVNVLRSPIIKADKKAEILKAVLLNRTNVLTTAFVMLLVNKGREASLPEIATAYIQQYRELKNIKTVKLTTARPVNDAVKQGILARISNNLTNKGTVELTTAVNPDLIGGFVLEMEDKLYDASVLRDLRDIKAQFLDDSYVSKLN
ncbi:MAG: ATP synthase F1 subunit delta [Flavipsychrobacter sp.]|nr:ATP synthase F1 subunit delta [Flavipsychrobacter sp.]